MQPLTCERVAELTDGVGLGVVPADLRSAVLEHASTCPTCRALLARLGPDDDETGTAGPALDPPARFADRTLARLAEERRAAGSGEARPESS